MPYISVKDLRKLDRYITKQCEMNPIDKMTKEDADQEIQDYYEITQIFFKLYKENEKLAKQSKETMRKRRANDPEKAKAYAKKYNAEYRKGLRRKEAK